MHFFETDKNNSNQNTASESPIIPIPEGLKITESSYELVIERRWFSFAHIFTLVFSLIWNGILAFFYQALLADGVPILMALFPLIHVAVGIGLFYYSIAGFFNKTQISAQQGVLGIRHFPLPWRGNRKLNSKDINQLYVKEKISRGKNGTSVTYDLRCLLQNGKSLSLVSSLMNSEEAVYLESKIESFFGIKDRPVQGELKN